MPNELSSRLDATQLHMVSRDRVASVVHGLLHGANHERPPELTAGVAVLFAAISERTGMDPHDLFLLGRRLLFAADQHHDKPNIQMEALRDFAGLRVRNQPIV